MTASSEFGHYITPAITLSADTPMSAATARWYVNNARHLIDQSSQTRVNWVAWGADNSADNVDFLPTNGLYWLSGGTDWVCVNTFHFPVSIIGKDAYKKSYDKPVNLVISVAGYTENSDELDFRAVIMPSGNNFGMDLVDDSCLAYWEDSTTSNSSEWIIDGVTTSLYPDDIRTRVTKRTFDLVEHDSKNYDVTMYMLRLTIYAKNGYSSGYGHLSGAYVREYQV